MKPPVKPDNIPSPPEGFIYAGKGDITKSHIFKTQQDMVGYLAPSLGWLTNMERTSPYGHYAVRTDSPIHKAQPWYRQEYSTISDLMRASLPLFTDEDLEAELERRRKPKTITVEITEFPEPIKQMPEGVVEKIYTPQLEISESNPSAMYSVFPASHPRVHILIKRGIVHLTKEAAIKHAEALISFTKLP